MKRLTILLSVVLMTLMMTSCSSNTPTKVAEKSMEYIKGGNYEGYVDMLYIKPDAKSNKEDVENEKQMLAAMIKDKASKKMEQKNSIKQYEVLSEEIAEDGKTAIVKMKITYGDGTDDTDNIKLRKDEDGNWKIDMGK